MINRIKKIRTFWQIENHRAFYVRPLYVLNWILYSARANWIYKFARRLERAKKVYTSNENFGIYADDTGAYVEFCGACPVQGDGEIDGYPCYYRSRGEGWQFHVATMPDGDPLDDNTWFYSENKYIFPQGGWVDKSVSLACIKKAVTEWRLAMAIKQEEK